MLGPKGFAARSSVKVPLAYMLPGVVHNELPAGHHCPFALSDFPLVTVTDSKTEAPRLFNVLFPKIG